MCASSILSIFLLYIDILFFARAPLQTARKYGLAENPSRCGTEQVQVSGENGTLSLGMVV